MAPRKSPYRHPVREYKRSDGKVVESYRRGKGEKPIKRKKVGKKPRKKGDTGFRVTLILSKLNEVYPVDSTTISGASYKGLQMLQTPEIPQAIRIRRITR